MARRKSDEEWRDIYLEKYNPEEFELIKFHREVAPGAYEILHKKCGNIFYVDITHVKRGDKCPKCAKNRKKTKEEWKELFLSSKNIDDYEYIDIFHETDPNSTKVRSYYKIKHKKCGNIFTPSTHDFLVRGDRCPECRIFGRPKTLEHYRKIFNPIYGENYELISKESYIDHNKWRIDFKIRCKNCGKMFVATDSWSKGVKCPNCAPWVASYGELRISEVLDKYDIPYIIQKWWDDCRNIRPLRFDFYIPSYDLVIEYNGRQHYEAVDIFGGDGYLLDLQKWDTYKKNYAISKGHKFLEIKYDQYDIIEDILCKTLNLTKIE